FAERVRSNQLASHEPWDVLPLLLLGAEAEERRDRQAGLGAERRRERGRPPDCLADDHRRDLVERHAAVLLGPVGRETPQPSAPLPQRLRERPVLLLEPIERRRHFGGDEFLGGLTDQPVLVGQALGEERGVRWRILDEPGAAFVRGFCYWHWCSSG